MITPRRVQEDINDYTLEWLQTDEFIGVTSPDSLELLALIQHLEDLYECTLPSIATLTPEKIAQIANAK